MKRNFKYCLLWILLMHFLPYSYAQEERISYSTGRLKEMAKHLNLKGIGLLSPGTYHLYSYQEHPLTVRINEWNEVEHIGFRLFANDSVRIYNPSPVYDFLERYFLELKLPSDLAPLVRLFVDKVYIDGNVEDVLSFDGTESFTESYVQLKKYAVSWMRDGKTLLSATFDMDYQLLSGCNALELENNLLRDIQRYKVDTKHMEPLPKIRNDFEHRTDMYVDKGDSYLLDLVRNDLYYVREKNKYTLINDRRKVNQSAANIMLSPHVMGDYDINIIFDQYGYKQEKVVVKLKRWLSFCLTEGCTPYFGIKSKDNTSLKGTVFMVNEKKGYNHILSVDIPVDVIGKQSGIIKARLYAYIPLHNVSDHYFELK